MMLPTEAVQSLLSEELKARLDVRARAPVDARAASSGFGRPKGVALRYISLSRTAKTPHFFSGESRISRRRSALESNKCL
jgi:hypothetical protein